MRTVPDTECMACGDGLRDRGVLVAAEALQPVETATTVRVRGRPGDESLTGRLPRRRSNSQGSTWSMPGISMRPRDLAVKIPPAREGSVEVRPVRQLET
jgi:hypothetical protein